MTQHAEVIVLGAGAAGLMCAAVAGQRGRGVVVLDHANKPGKKILMSGGGRCNFTNLDITPAHYISSNPHFCKSALSRYTQWDFLALVNEYQIPYHEKINGQLFCDNKASDILNMLLAECDKAGVSLTLGCEITGVSKTDAGFCLDTSGGEYTCDSLVVATGGLSIPSMGATGLGFDIAKQFGHAVVPYCASLVPLTLSGKYKETAAELAGLSLPVSVHNPRTSFSGDLLFTHRGISGPVILQMSNYWDLGESLTLNFLPQINLTEQWDRWRSEQGRSEVRTLLYKILPRRFVNIWLQAFDLSRPVAEISKGESQKISATLQQWQFTPAGTEGYRTAEVTRGGVATDAISSKTFASNNVPGLYFIGEVLDVTGWLGGYNFQWAWASGWCAGQVV